MSTAMSQTEFAALRDYADGSPLDKGEKPPASVLRKGWLHLVVDNFYEITPKGLETFTAMRQGRGGGNLG